MRVSFEWLKEFVDVNLSAEEVAGLLTMTGLEVEGKEDAGDDVIFEVNVTPNRPDCLSVRGIARELSAALSIPLKFPEFKLKEEDSDDGFKVEILNAERCRRYAGRVVRGVKVAQSPEWIKKRINKCGIRAINNIVDITNYVLLEFGHPLHAFDLDTLKGRTIKVDVAGKDNDIVTLDGIERKLPENALLIWDAKNPVAIAGIMGGSDTQVVDSTKDIFIESAFFEPASIRRSSKALGMKTESSYRFERGADIEFLDKALDRAAFLIQQAAGGKVYKKVDAYPKKFVPVTIDVKYDKVNGILGTNIPRTDMVAMIRRLDIEVEPGDHSFSVKAPSFRPDLKRDADVIEEAARLYGYHRIHTTVPKAGISPVNSERKRAIVSMIKEAVKKAGFTEAVNYSFMNESDLELLDIHEGDRRRRAISIKNPLRKEESLLRTTLVPSLIRNFMHNFSRDIKDIRIFETAKVFEDMGRPLPLEIAFMGGIYYRAKMPELWKDDAGSFYIVKGMIEALFDAFHIRGYSFSDCREPFLHAGQSADIRVKGSNIGFVGALSPAVAERLDLKVAKPEIIVFEIDMDKLISMIPVSLEYSPVPRFPGVERDIAVILDERLTAAEVENLIRTYPSEIIEDVSIFDLFKGGSIPEGKKSLAFTIKYRSRHRTLTEAEVEDTHQNIIRYITSETGGKLRV